jgi:hypothetical protein
MWTSSSLLTTTVPLSRDHETLISQEYYLKSTISRVLYLKSVSLLTQDYLHNQYHFFVTIPSFFTSTIDWISFSNTLALADNSFSRSTYSKLNHNEWNTRQVEEAMRNVLSKGVLNSLIFGLVATSPICSGNRIEYERRIIWRAIMMWFSRVADLRSVLEREKPIS